MIEVLGRAGCCVVDRIVNYGVKFRDQVVLFFSRFSSGSGAESLAGATKLEESLQRHEMVGAGILISQ